MWKQSLFLRSLVLFTPLHSVTHNSVCINNDSDQCKQGETLMYKPWELRLRFRDQVSQLTGRKELFSANLFWIPYFNHIFLGSVASRILGFEINQYTQGVEVGEGGTGTGPDHYFVSLFPHLKKSPLTSLLKPTANITPYRSQSNRWMFNAIQDILLQQVPLVMVTGYSVWHTEEGTLKSPCRAQYKEANLGPNAFSSLATIPTPITPSSLMDSRETWSPHNKVPSQCGFPGPSYLRELQESCILASPEFLPVGIPIISPRCLYLFPRSWKYHLMLP